MLRGNAAASLRFTLLRAVCAALVVTALANRAVGAEVTLELDVRVNGHPIGKIGEFTSRDGVLLARRSELTDLGFRVPGKGDALIPLSRLPGLHWHLNQATQELDVTTGNANLLPALLRLETAQAPPAFLASGTGAVLNYDATYTHTRREDVASGEYELRGFSPWGVLSASTLGFIGDGPAGPGSNAAIRLDTSYTLADPLALRSYVVGDFITGSLDTMRPVRLGGVQISSNYSLRPDLVTFPLPTVGGSVAVPSTVDVLVNGSQLMSRSVAPGPFEVPELPVVSGAGTVSLTVTNALGRQVVVSLPFYASADLLAPGLQTWSAQLGAVRRNWGVISDEYHGVAGTGTWRRGLTPWLTLQAGAEAMGGTVMANGGVALNLLNQAVLDVSGALSTSPQAAWGRGGRTEGGQFSAGLQRVGRVYSLSLSATAASNGFRDIAALNGDPVAQLQLNAGAGLSLGRAGSLGFTYARVTHATAPQAIPEYVPAGDLGRNGVSNGGVEQFQPPQRAQIISASYSRQLGNVAFYATGFRDVVPHGDNGVLLGLSVPFGGRASASSSVGAGSGGRFAQAQLSQSPVSVGDWGYQAVGSAGTGTRGYGEVTYKSPYALLTAGADQSAGQTTLRGEAEGAVSAVDGGVFASNRINDSFAVVDTDGLANVRVLQENRVAGRTDSAGRLLVPDLRAFDTNHLAIDANDVPQDIAIASIEREVRPQFRSGVVVKFANQVSHGALLSLVDTHGKVLPLGSVATLTATGVAAPVGFDGQTYVEGLKAHNIVTVEGPQGARCRVTFAYRAVKGEIPSIGPLICG